ncbi:hypothetical protein CW304_09405 [Bacillus sp. UFRGS-B20]|nr:hypothetical protein CW304_09405 [Bacillus sp. UFRGS-B20]
MSLTCCVWRKFQMRKKFVVRHNSFSRISARKFGIHLTPHPCSLVRYCVHFPFKYINSIPYSVNKKRI